MRTLGKYIEEISPKFNLQMVEGVCYHRLNKAIEYIDTFIKYSCQSKTSTHLKYLGYKELLPKDEMRFLFNKTSKVVHDIAENDIYLVEFYFQYGENEEIRKYQFYVPYLNKGNIIHLSGGKFLVLPTLSDKVISVGERIIFINILTAKYSFSRSYSSVVVGNKFHRVPLINTELYKNQSKKLEDTTKANTSVMHYLLANYGYSRTMEMLLGFVPKAVYDYDKDDMIVIKSTNNPPHGYIGIKTLYKPTSIKFLIDPTKYNEHVLYVVGNIFYILDNFPQSISIDELDNTVMWKRLLAEIIHSGNHGLAYLSEKINAHFNDLNSSFDAITCGKLVDVNVNSKNLMELLVAIFENFNTWIMNSESRSLYHNKSYEVESFVLSTLTSRITRIVLDINKEEMRIGGAALEDKVVDKIFKTYFLARAIFRLRAEKQFITSVESSNDHLYPKNTSMVVQQESDFVNVKKTEVNTSERKKMVASMATVGSIFGLSKHNPTPLIRANPYVRVHEKTGTVLPHEHLMEIVERTDRLLANMVSTDSVETDQMQAILTDTTDAIDDDLDVSEFLDDGEDEDLDSIELD